MLSQERIVFKVKVPKNVRRHDIEKLQKDISDEYSPYIRMDVRVRKIRGGFSISFDLIEWEYAILCMGASESDTQENILKEDLSILFDIDDKGIEVKRAIS